MGGPLGGSAQISTVFGFVNPYALKGCTDCTPVEELPVLNAYTNSVIVYSYRTSLKAFSIEKYSLLLGSSHYIVWSTSSDKGVL